MQKLFLEMFCSQTITSDLCQSSISWNERIQEFWRLKKTNFPDAVKNTFLLKQALTICIGGYDCAHNT